MLTLRAASADPRIVSPDGRAAMRSSRRRSRPVSTSLKEGSKLMKLYFAPHTCSLSPHIVLRELGLPFELVRVNNKTKQTSEGRSFLEVNPKGYVAALVLDNGEVLTEGPAILQFLADLKPEARLAPANGTW